MTLVDGSEGGDSCGNSTERKTQQAARQRRLRLTMCPRKATAVANINSEAKSVRLIKSI